jgi:hypothetical protein
MFSTVLVARKSTKNTPGEGMRATVKTSFDCLDLDGAATSAAKLDRHVGPRAGEQYETKVRAAARRYRRFRQCSSCWDRSLPEQFPFCYNNIIGNQKYFSHSLAMERTATRCAFTFYVASAPPLRAMCVLGGRRSSCSR